MSDPEATTYRVIDHLAAIKVHASALDRRLRRAEAIDLAHARTRLEAISQEVDAAA
jgi:hypothetical protein